MGRYLLLLLQVNFKRRIIYFMGTNVFKSSIYLFYPPLFYRPLKFSPCSPLAFATISGLFTLKAFISSGSLPSLSVTGARLSSF